MKTKKVRRIFGGLIVTQERWLNEMSGKGYRLNYISGKRYDFIECEPGKYKYKIFMLKEGENPYICVKALEEQGYNAFVISVSALRVVVYMGSMPSSYGNAHRSEDNKDKLVIVEKISTAEDPDAEFITTDIKKPIKKYRNAYFITIIAIAIEMIISHFHWLSILVGVLMLVPLVRFQIELSRLNKR